MYLGKVIKNLNNNFKKHSFSNICLNSKSCKKNSIFFAIKGFKEDGNKFINEAIKNGARTIISQNSFQGYKKNILFLTHKNPRFALSQIAKKIYKNLPNNIIAVTGTNGKSSIADFYYQIMNLNNIRCATIGTLGVKSKTLNKKTYNTSPDLITLYEILKNLKKSKVNNCVLEASSHGLSQHRLDGIKINSGIFSNISRDHYDFHKNYKNYLEAKLLLFNKIVIKNGNAIFNKNFKESKKIIKICKKRKIKISTVGRNSSINVEQIRSIKNYQEVIFTYKKKKFLFKTQLIGDVQINNLMLAILVATKYLSIEKIANVLPLIKPIKGRFEEVGKLKNEARVILDYAHTPDALESCIKTIKKQYKNSKISIVFGCGGERDKNKRIIMGRIANKFCEKIFLTDDNPRNENPEFIRRQIKMKINKRILNEIPSRAIAIKKAIFNLKSGDTLIVAGKGHENYQQYKSKIFFSDKLYIKKFIKLKNNILSNHWKTNIVNEHIGQKKVDKKIKIENFSINSKIIKKNECFIGIKGKKFDGNQFADQAIKNKAVVALVDKKYGKDNKKKIKIEDTLKTFSIISCAIRTVSNLEAIAITGSSGKTSLKELLGQTLSKISNTTYANKSFNNKYGVPKSLSEINLKSQFGVFEIGMDRKGEINQLAKLVKPDLGIITNISYAHIKNFNNLQGIASAKSELIDQINKDGAIILNKNDKFFKYFQQKAKKKGLKIISFGKKTNADIIFVSLKKQDNKYLFSIKKNKKFYRFNINPNLSNYIENLLAASAAISYYIDLDKLNKNIFLNYNIPKGRGDKFVFKNKSKKINVIDESYNSNPLSLRFSIENFSNLYVNKAKKYLLLGDMLELGKFSKKLHLNISKIVNKSNIDKVYVYGRYIKHTFNKIKIKKRGTILKKLDDIRLLIKTLKRGDYLMIKGSNSTGLNLMVKNLKKKNAI